MKKCSGFVLLILFIQGVLLAQVPSGNAPKLVVGVVVDQMRWDYLYRFSNRYATDGFRRLLSEGFSCENTFIPYTPTYTAPGHTCVYTGSVPSLHGIIGNNWYDETSHKIVYCTDDSAVQAVGSNSAAGKMSPKNLWANTITDELRLSNNFSGKTIAIALKDRGAILPGGHTANGAYWFDNTIGGFITSTYYMPKLPDWVTKFNAKKLPDQYLKQNWNTLYPINTYVQSTADKKQYEGAIPGGGSLFPHQTDTVKNNKYEVLKYLPYGNTYTVEMAKAAIEGEGLGKHNATDFLAISFSSTDYIGHTFGPNSIEIEDTYLRLDRDLANFLNYLDGAVGKGNYLLFLTADHGAASVPRFAMENKLPGGNVDDAAIKQQLNTALQQQFNIADLITVVMNYQVYLNEDAITKNGLALQTVKKAVIENLLANPAIAKAIDLSEVQNETLPEPIKMMVINGYNQKLSGDVQFIFKPQYLDMGGNTGTTHGSWYPYDAHIPLVWYGWHVKKGSLSREVHMTDIAPTVAALLHIQRPNATIGNVIEEVVK